MNTEKNERAVEIGTNAPDFTLLTDKGERWNLSENAGRVITLLFYPKNETLMCTRQLCSVRDNWAAYLETNTTVVGISPGTPEEHQNFVNNYNLPLSLLADADRKITRRYTGGGLFPVWLTRAVVVIDARGIVRSREVMLRAFRPSDAKILASIRSAKSDFNFRQAIHG